VKKVVKIDERANKELLNFNSQIKVKFFALFKILEKDGFLKEPFAKKISLDLFEVRVKHKGEWRAIYAYFRKAEIIVLSAFHKKTQKTAKKELKKAEKRLRDYL
jgi:phage-related protein